MKKNSTPKQDDYEVKDEYDLFKMTVLPRGQFVPELPDGQKCRCVRARYCPGISE